MTPNDRSMKQSETGGVSDDGIPDLVDMMLLITFLAWGSAIVSVVYGDYHLIIPFLYVAFLTSTISLVRYAIHIKWWEGESSHEC